MKINHVVQRITTGQRQCNLCRRRGLGRRSAPPRCQRAAHVRKHAGYLTASVTRLCANLGHNRSDFSAGRLLDARKKIVRGLRRRIRLGNGLMIYRCFERSGRPLAVLMGTRRAPLLLVFVSSRWFVYRGARLDLSAETDRFMRPLIRGEVDGPWQAVVLPCRE